MKIEKATVVATSRVLQSPYGPFARVLLSVNHVTIATDVEMPSNDDDEAAVFELLHEMQSKASQVAFDHGPEVN